MNEKIEGTIALDGMIEGRLPPEGELEQKLNDWIKFAATLGLRFTLDIDGNSFSVLADAKPVDATKLSPDPGGTVREAVDQLFQAFPAAQRTSLFSTLRSSEFRPGQEVQAIYSVAADGHVEITERTVDAETVAPAAPMSVKEGIKLGVFGLAIAIVVIGISTLFIDYGAMWSNLSDATRKVDQQSLPIAAGPMSSYFTVTKIERSTINRRIMLVMTLERTDAYPTSAEQLQQAYDAADGKLPDKLALESIARGYATVELYGKKGELLSFSTIRIAGLDGHQSIEVAAPMPKHRPAMGLITY